MPYATHTTVDAPAALYAAIHAHVLKATQGKVDGLLVHLARPTPTGFEVFEVWESREHCDKIAQDVLGPALAAAAVETGTADTLAQPHVEDFTPSGLVIPAADVAL